MSTRRVLRHEFVEYVPEVPEEGVIYVSVRFATAVHRCCCGCGVEVATPISPADWQVTFDGESVSLYPSIGNWSLPCQSHYWIRRNRIVWARRWSAKEIAEGRASDHLAMAEYLAERNETPTERRSAPAPAAKEPWWRRIWRRLF